MNWKDVIDFFSSGKWWPTLIGIIMAGILVSAFLDIFKSFLFGLFLGFVLAIADMVAGEKIGYSLTNELAEVIESSIDWIVSLF